MTSPKGEDKLDSTPLFTNPQELEQVIFAMTQPDNDKLKKATLLLSDFFENPKSIVCLIQQIEKSTKKDVRRVAAFYLREQIDIFWKTIPNDVKERLKKFLLKKLFEKDLSDEERMAMSGCIVETAKHIFKKGEWNELLVALDKACKPEAPTPMKESGITVWRNLLQFCGGSLKKHFGNILKIIKSGLTNKDSEKVQLESVKAIGAMVDFLEHKKEVEIVESFIPGMVQVIENGLRNGKEDVVVQGMEVFSDMVESPIPILAKHGKKLTEFMLKIASAQGKLPLPVRKQAVNFMTYACKSKPKTVIKHKFVGPFLKLCVNILMESDEIGAEEQETPDEDTKLDQEDPDFCSPLGIACDLLDEIFINIASEECFPLAMDAIKQLHQDKDEKKRIAAYVMLAMMCEGCSLIISQDNNMMTLLNACIGGTNDEKWTVRKCALEAIAQLVVHLNDDMLPHHELILTAVFKVFKKPDEDMRVKERALALVELFIDCFDDFNAKLGTEFPIEKYMPPMMGLLGNCLKSKNKSLQTQAVATLASLAACAKDKFHRYVPQVLSLLEQLLKIQDENKVILRAEATSCLGAVAKSAGKSIYGPHLSKFHELVLEGLQHLDSFDLREATYMYFSDLSDLMGEDICKLESFEAMVYGCIGSMADEDGLIVEVPDDGFGAAVPAGFLQNSEKFADDDEFDVLEFEDTKLGELAEGDLAPIDGEDDENDSDNEDDDEDDDDDDDLGDMGNVKMQIQTGAMEEKAAAIHALSRFIANTRYNFLQYFDDVWEQIIYLWEYPHGTVKMSLVNCAHEMLMLLGDHSMDELAKRDESKVTTELDGTRHFNWTWGQTDNYSFDKRLATWMDKTYALWIQSIHDEADKDVLSAIIDTFSDELRIFGPLSITSHMNNLCAAMSSFFKEKSVCHNNADLENDDVKDVANKHKFVTDCMAELCGCLAELWGAKFIPVFEKLYPSVIRWAKPNRHAHDLGMAVGCIADVATRLFPLGSAPMDKFGKESFKIALRVAQSKDNNARQNALYCIGALFMTCSQATNLEYLQNALRCVNTYMKFDKEGEHTEQLVRDNAVSALGKIIMSETENIPVDTLLPAFLNGLPITGDFAENYWVYHVLIHLCKNDKKVIMPHLAQILALFADALSSDAVGKKTKGDIATTVKTMCGNENVRRLVGEKLNEEQKANILKCCE